MHAPLISPTTLNSALQQPGLLVLDASVELAAARFDGDYRIASGRAAWLQGHIPGAHHADLTRDLADTTASFSFALPSVEQAAAALSRLGVGQARDIVVYDRQDGFWAARLWWMLRSLGIAARVLDGGLRAWQNTGLALAYGEEAAAQHPSSALDISARAGYWASRDDVLAVLAGQRQGTLVCALSAGLFDGSAITRYARRGHIPGSLNRPARTLFDDQGRYLPRQALTQALGTGLVEGDEPLILYCGGGISAAATALALTLLGRPNVYLYDGSLQEWAADPALPMTTGAAPT
ncbi:sulfurtransferase [Pseudomonas sp. S31]|uniref:sulfurtransferase n=1 Tax=Pseudomonas sp. S31 TaxID=1564473 RepID=UPI00191306D5|nr:rhodanese-like domain-containing protein [Pseudomonas sp. S31]MBK4998098.1 sulfurtransferase [Pseudomonas sp. S31]